MSDLHSLSRAIFRALRYWRIAQANMYSGTNKAHMNSGRRCLVNKRSGFRIHLWKKFFASLCLGQGIFRWTATQVHEKMVARQLQIIFQMVWECVRSAHEFDSSEQQMLGGIGYKGPSNREGWWIAFRGICQKGLANGSLTGYFLSEWQRNAWGVLNTGVVGSGSTWAVNVIIVLWSIGFPMKCNFPPNDSVKSSVGAASSVSNASLPSLPSWKWYVPISLCTDNISSIQKCVDPPVGRQKGFAGHQRGALRPLGPTIYPQGAGFERWVCLIFHPSVVLIR